MIDLHQLPKITSRSKKRLGQGSGSGKGKTAGRGTKGQKARGKIPFRLKEGGVSLIRRLPLFRGKYRNKGLKKRALVINLGKLTSLTKGTQVDMDLLIKMRLVKEDLGRAYGVKILGDGELKVPLVVKLPCSKRAKKKIEKAGGQVII